MQKGIGMYKRAKLSPIIVLFTADGQSPCMHEQFRLGQLSINGKDEEEETYRLSDEGLWLTLSRPGL